MDAISLPLYQSSEQDSINDVLIDLRQRSRSGVVIEDGDDFRLLFAGDLLRGRANGMSSIQQLAGGEQVLLLGTNHALQYGVDLVRPLQTQTEYMNLFQSVNYSYALAGAVVATALVVSDSEYRSETLTLTGGYECDGTPTHYFPEPKVTPGQTCPEYPLCTGPGGGRSTIHPSP